MQPRVAEPKDVTQEDIGKEAYCARTEPAVLTYDAHAAPIGMVFYDEKQFPDAYRGDAFIAYHGSWNREKAVGYKVVRTRFQSGKAIGWEDFLSGFINQAGTAYFGRPAGVVVAGDGSLLISDDVNGVIYRVSLKDTN